MPKKLTHCKKCENQLAITKNYKTCVNLGCIKYMVKVGRKIVRQEEEE